MSNKPMKTAKEIAFKAFLENIDGKFANESPASLRERFDNWWSEWYHHEEHRGCFYHEHDVYIDGIRYIKAE